MRRVIIESPFAGATPELAARNLRYARACLRFCLCEGWSPYASHLLYTQPGVLRDEVLDERLLGIKAGFVWRRSSEATVVFHDLGFSFGMLAGITDAKTLIAGGAIHELEFVRIGGEWELGLSENGRP